MFRGVILPLLALILQLRGLGAEAAREPKSGTTPAAPAITNSPLHLEVRGYVAAGGKIGPVTFPDSMFSKFIGTNVSLAELVNAAAEARNECAKFGFTNITVSIAPDRITNGIVTLNVFPARVPQILVSGVAYQPSEFLTAAPAPGKTNAEPHFEIRAYEIRGETLLTIETLVGVLAKYTGTNMVLGDIRKAASDLQGEYVSRGYPTVRVTVPQQEITNGIVRFRVFQGRLARIDVLNNHYFTSNNVMRALPSLSTNIILSAPVFQAELNRANANRDRQIYPELRPGPDPNTTDLLLLVKDRLPLHGRLELNNANTPGTPELRLNSSLVYNNLWQLEHSLGLQYSFSPEVYKKGDQWNFYDLPLVANYSAFYRLPLARPESVGDATASRPGEFGYSEATRQFRLPPASGVPEFNVFASRSTIDTGVEVGQPERLFTAPDRTIDQQDSHQDITINEDVGFRLSEPIREFSRIRSGISFGLDYKKYSIASFATNTFIFTEFLTNSQNQPYTRVTSTASPVPADSSALNYLPLTVGWDASRQDKTGITGFGLSYRPNLWFLGGRANVEAVAGSSEATGFWQILGANMSRDQQLYKDWRLVLRADGQWASEPLISNEQYGVGGLSGVRGYQEGQVFGDLGWRLTSEVRSPTVLVGQGFDKYPMYLRGIMFMDYGQVFLLDPQGRQGITDLWGTGLGASFTFGSHFDARVAAAWPLIAVPGISAGQTRFYFAIAGQF